MKHLIRFRWTTQPLDEIDTAATGAAHSMGVTLISVEARAKEVDIVASAGRRFSLCLAPGPIGAELVLDTRDLDGAVAHEAIDFMLAFSAELGGVIDDFDVDAHALAPAWDRVAS